VGIRLKKLFLYEFCEIYLTYGLALTYYVIGLSYSDGWGVKNGEKLLGVSGTNSIAGRSRKG
jgi:hypothetical protein